MGLEVVWQAAGSWGWQAVRGQVAPHGHRQVGWGQVKVRTNTPGNAQETCRHGMGML